MFTYFLVGEDSSHRQQRLSSSLSASPYPSDGLAVNDRCDTTAVSADELKEPVKLVGDRGWPAGPGESRRPPLLPRCEHGTGCDLAMESIFPNFRRSLVASSKRRRFRHRSTIDANMSNSLQDCSVHDAATTTKDTGVLTAIARQKDFRIPKSSILESASTVQIPAVEAEEDGMINGFG